jgi:hypothetical protein
VTCIFLAGLYTIFAVLLFLCYASEEVSNGFSEPEAQINAHKKTPLVTVTAADSADYQRQLDSPGFITMDNSSVENSVNGDSQS